MKRRDETSSDDLQVVSSNVNGKPRKTSAKKKKTKRSVNSDDEDCIVIDGLANTNQNTSTTHSSNASKETVLFSTIKSSPSSKIVAQDVSPSLISESHISKDVETEVNGSIDAIPRDRVEDTFKYTVKFKCNSFEEVFYLNDNDPIELIYTKLFGEDCERKLLYEGMKLSRFLTAVEVGFFPGVNYINLPANETYEVAKELFIMIKINEKVEDDVKVKLTPRLCCTDLIVHLNTMGIQTKEKSLLFNGEIIDLDRNINEFMEEDFTIDLLDNSLFK